MSASPIILVSAAPPKFKAKMKDQACMTDDTLRVTVEVEGTPAPELQWCVARWPVGGAVGIPGS